MLGYQALIIDASIQYDGDGWMGYDRRFRLSAAANSTKSWASLDTTLWNLAFTGYAKVARCKHCFCLTHASSECEWATDAAETVTSPSAKQYIRIYAGNGTTLLDGAPYLVVPMNRYALTVLMTQPSATSHTK